MIKKYATINRDEAIELFMGVFSAEPFCYTWLRREAVERYFTDLANTPAALSFLYYNNKGLLTGLCFGAMNDYFIHKLYDIKEFAVRKDAQGKGEGRRMLEEISGCLKSEGVAAVTLSTQREIPAYEFYLKNGFVASKSSVTLSKKI
ncbi:MAG: GNAT family N-acetyltransferase [Defluviitaleaceae bacterium]|nr:GNAT family N-acetyltransferase [Defluviitaleaceae bacterium]